MDGLVSARDRHGKEMAGKRAQGGRKGSRGADTTPL